MREEREFYIWALTDEWGQCDKICSGTLYYTFKYNLLYTYCIFVLINSGEQSKIYVCIKKDTGEEARGYCSEHDIPHPPKQPCNLHCSIK